MRVGNISFVALSVFVAFEASASFDFEGLGDFDPTDYNALTTIELRAATKKARQELGYDGKDPYDTSTFSDTTASYEEDSIDDKEGSDAESPKGGYGTSFDATSFLLSLERDQRKSKARTPRHTHASPAHQDKISPSSTSPAIVITPASMEIKSSQAKPGYIPNSSDIIREIQEEEKIRRKRTYSRKAPDHETRSASSVPSDAHHVFLPVSSASAAQGHGHG